VAEGGFVSFRSYLDRPQSLRASYRLSASSAGAWDGIDQEIPAPLFVFDILHRLDLPDLFGSLTPKPILIVRPQDGERQALGEQAAEQLLRGGRFRWRTAPQVATGDDAERQLNTFLADRAKTKEQ
jgi:hypothetical protein